MMSSGLKFIRISLALMLILCGSSVKSQEKNVFNFYDSLTYAQYQNENWSGLVKSTRMAIREGLDYYYLRMRAGIALYEKGNYLLAERQFNRALKLNDIDPVAREYVYYSKLYTGRQKEASLYYKRNLDYLKNKLKSENKAVKSFLIDAAYHFNSDDRPGSLINAENFTDTSGNQTITRNYFYAGFLLEHDITRYLVLSHGGSVLRKYNYYFYASPNLILDSYDHRINQTQYYARLGFYPGADININAAIHYVNFISPDLVYRQRGYGTMYTIPGINDNYLLSRLSVYKYVSLFQLGGGISYSNLNNRYQFQKDMRLVFYPLGNLDLYTVTAFYHITESGGNKTNKYPVFAQNVGFRVASKLWAEVRYWTGEMKNMSANEGYVVYNGNETVTQRLDLNLIIPDEKMTFSINGSWLNYYSVFVDADGNTTELNNLNFKGLTLIAEIKWNF